MSLLGLGLLAGGSALLGSVVSGLFGSKATRDTNAANASIAQQNNEFNAQQSALQYQRTIDLWNMENNYNTPANQVKRLQEAGLSPYLAYSNASAGGTASHMTAPSAVRAESYQYRSPMAAYAQMFGQILPNLLNLELMHEKVKQAKIETNALPMILSNRSQLLGEQANLYGQQNQFYGPLQESLLGVRSGERMLQSYKAQDYAAKFNLMGILADTNRLKYEILKQTGLSTAQANLGLLNRRIQAMTFDKQIGEARLDLLRQQYELGMLRGGLMQKQGDILDRNYNILGQQYRYNEKFGYGGSHDWLRMLMQTGQGILQNVTNPFKWARFGTSNIGKYYNQNFYY